MMIASFGCIHIGHDLNIAIKKLCNVRSIYPKSINSGAQYLLIDEYPLSIWCSKPDVILSKYKKFEDCLIDFIECTTGRQFSPNKYNLDNWGKMIFDLLKNNENRLYKVKSVGHNNKNSIITHYINMSNSIINNIDWNHLNNDQIENYAKNIDNYALSDSEYEGISTILIEGIDNVNEYEE